MILSDKEILKSIKKGEIVIKPFRAKCLGTNSYDVHLGKYLAVYKDRVLDAKKHNQIEEIIIGETGLIEGQINCTNAVVQGRFEGTLNVKELLNVRKTAVINGEITTNKLIVEAGAIFNVSCKMGKQKAHSISIERTNQQRKPKAKAS